MLKTNPAEFGEDVYFSGISLNLLETLSEGMHAIAQPLTVLRATLEIASGNACSVSQFQHAVDASLKEVTRVSDGMRFVQELLRISREASDPVPVALAEVIASVEEDLQCVFQTKQASIKACFGDGAEQVWASPSRIRQCFFYLIQHAVGSCGPGTRVRLGSALINDQVRVVIHIENLYGSDPDEVRNQPMSGGPSSCLILAETLARADGVQFLSQPHPFVAQLSFPRALKRKDVRSASVDLSDRVRMNGTRGDSRKKGRSIA